MQVMKVVDPNWNRQCVFGGLASGEGLISALSLRGDESKIDKRLLIFEPEFSKVLKVSSRLGNTLSDIIRQAWDSGNLRVLTRNSPLKATNAHVSIIAHITADELKSELTLTDLTSGFANRFIFIWTDRAKLLPLGGNPKPDEMKNLADEIRNSVRFAQQVRQLPFKASTVKVWEALYSELATDRAGQVGAALARAEAQVLRLGMIYALLDSSNYVEPDHLLAAYEVWQFSEQSVQHIFNENPIQSRILLILSQSTTPITRTELHRAFANHLGKKELEEALCDLEDRGQIREVEEGWLLENTLAS
jgi:hypothetical protein